jgi:hypothetical protein
VLDKGPSRGIEASVRLFPTTLLILALVACTSIPPSRDFSTQVLAPLADELADARVERVKKAVTTGQIPFTELGSLLGPHGASVEGGSDVLNKNSLSKQVAAIEARRGPLKAEILALIEQRVKRTETGLAVCVEGKERRYDYSGGQFVRVADGPGPCERTKLRTTFEIPP